MLTLLSARMHGGLVAEARVDGALAAVGLIAAGAYPCDAAHRIALSVSITMIVGVYLVFLDVALGMATRAPQQISSLSRS